MGKFGGFGGGGAAGGGMGNMQNLIKQAQQMQQQMQQAQAELAETEVVGSSGGEMVKVTMTCKKQIVGISIKPEIVDPTDVEMLEDLIVAAFNDASNKADELSKDKMGPLSGSMGGMF